MNLTTEVMTKKETNPYMKARDGWDERYGTLLDAKRNWQWIAYACALATAACAFALVWSAHRLSNVPPMVFIVDGATGQRIMAANAVTLGDIDETVRTNAIKQWIEDFRLVSVDGLVQAKAVRRVYAELAAKSSARGVVNDFYVSDPPTSRAQKGTLTVDVNSVEKADPASNNGVYIVDWTETQRELNGELKAKQRFKATITTVFNPPKTLAAAQANALGLYVSGIDYKQLADEPVQNQTQEEKK